MSGQSDLFKAAKIADKKEKVHLLICWQAIFENWQLY